jgi:hypothetical protein
MLKSRVWPAASFGAWAAAAAWLAVIAVTSLWLVRTPEGELREELRRWQFWSLETLFILLLWLSCINVPRFVRSLELRRQDFAVPLAASVLAFALTNWVAPRTNRIYYDEQIYQGIGQNLSDLRLAQMCNDGNVEYGRLQCWRGEYNKEPYGYPYLLSVAYRVSGVREGTAFILNAFAAALIVWTVFLLTTALTGQAGAGGYAAVVAALIPEQLRWSHSAASEPSAALACAFAMLAAVAFVRQRSTSALLWMAVATTFALQFRPECILVVAAIAIVIALYAPDEFRRARIWWTSALALALLTVHLGHLVAVRHEGWGTAGARMSTAYFAANLSANGWFYVADSRFPAVYSVLALAAFVSRRVDRALVVAAVYFLLFWGVFLFFYAGSYNYGADDRFSLMTYPPLAIMAGIGTSRLSRALDRTGRLGSPAWRVAAGALFLQFLWYMPLVRSIGEEAWGARADVEFAKLVARELPRNSFVLTHNPGMFHLWGVSASQASIATTEAGYAQNVLAPRYAGGVFFHWNFWCNVADPLQQSFCAAVLQRFPHTLIREYRERDYRYALYRLDVAPVDPPKGR